MSTISTATTLVTWDHITGNKVDILNCVCSGTDQRPWHSIWFCLHTGEDIIDICIQLGQTHPKGVLQYSPSPNDPHRGGKTPCQLQANLGDLVDAKLWKLMEDLHQEVTLKEINAPPGTHHWPLGEIQWEMGTPMWMTGRSPFWEGDGENPEDNHFDSLLLPNQMMGGNPEETTLTPCFHPTAWRCRTSYKHTGHWLVTWYPLY